MTEIIDVLNAIDTLRAEINLAMSKMKISPAQIEIQSGISEISEKLGRFLSGDISGWQLGETSLTDETGVVGMSSEVTAADDVRFWAGGTTPTTAPFNVTEAGVLTATSAIISGVITATSGNIGGFVVGATSIKDIAGLMGMSSAVTGGDDIRFFAGHATPSSAPFRVTEAGVLTSSSADIAGWTIDSTTIQKLTANVGIIIDSANQIIKVGDTAGTYFALDGANQRIRSSNFVTGVSGFNVAADTGDAEFNNITARGELKTFLLTSANQMAVAGDIIISPDAGKLGAAVTAIATKVDFGKALTPGDWIKIAGPDSAGTTAVEWMLIGALDSGTTYNVTRDVDGSGANAWLKDTPFAVIGANGDSRIELVAGATGTIRLVTQGATWNTNTVQAEMSTVDGAIMAGRGSISINDAGITFQDGGDALTFYDSQNLTYSLSSLKVDDASLPMYEQYIFTVANETNQISNGDFNTGDFTGWTVTDPGSQISIAQGGGVNGSDAAILDGYPTCYIQQNLAVTGTKGVVVKITAMGPGIIYISNATYTTKITVTGNTNTYQNFYRILPSSTTYIKIGSDGVYIDDVTVRILDPTTQSAFFNLSSTTSELASNHITFFGGVPTSKTATTQFRIDIDYATGFFININKGDFDTRFSGVNDTNLLKIDAGNDRVGIGTSSPLSKLTVSEDIGLMELAADPAYSADVAKLYYLDTGAVKIRHKQGATETEFTLGNITDAQATDLTDGGVTMLHTHAGGGLAWEIITANQTAEANHGYIANKGTLLTLLLPATAAVNDIVRVSGMGAGGWIITQNASGVIHFGNKDTTVGVGGSLASVHIRDAVELICCVANNEWNVISSVGNITVV